MTLAFSNRVWRWVVSGMLLLMLLAGCQPTDDAPIPTLITLPTATDQPPSPTPADTATPRPTATPAPTAIFGRDVPADASNGQVRVTNYVRDEQVIEVYLDGLLFNAGLRAGYSSALTPIRAGLFTAALDAQGTRAATAFEVTAGQLIDLLVIGEGQDLQILPIAQTTQPLDAGQAWVSVVSALPPDANISIGIDAQPTTAFTQTIGEPQVIEAGAHTFRAALGGQPVVDETLTLRELTVYTLVLTTTRANPQMRLQRLEAPVLGRYSAQIVHLSADTREIDVYLNGERIAQDVAFTDALPPRELVTAPQRLSIYTAGADRSVSPPLLENYSISARPSTRLMLFLVGTPDRLRVVPYEWDTSPVPVGSARVVFFNAVPDVVGLTAGIGPEPFDGFRPLGYTQFSTGQIISAGEFTLVMRDSINTSRDIIEAKTITLSAGQHVIYAATGRDDLPPATYRITVEQSEALAADGSRLPESRVRFVNGLADGITVDVYVNGLLSLPALIAPAGGPLTPLLGEEFSLLVRQNNDGPALVDIRLPLPTPDDYSLYFYGSPSDGLQTVMVNDSRLNIGGSGGTLRLVHLSDNPDAVFSLYAAQRPADYTPIPPTLTPVLSAMPSPTPEIPWTPEPTAEPFTIPLDARPLVRDVAGGTASIQVLAPPNYFDLLLTDAGGRILARLDGLTVPTGMHYDVAAYTYRTASGVQTMLFIAPYPPR